MILLAKENNGYVYVYSETKKVLTIQGELYHYTDTHVAVKRNGTIYLYKEDSDKPIKEYPKDFVDMSNVIGIYI